MLIICVVQHQSVYTLQIPRQELSRLFSVQKSDNALVQETIMWNVDNLTSMVSCGEPLLNILV